jgi:hypothetical protein
MVKSAEYRLSKELAEPLDRPMARRILEQRQMRSNPSIPGRKSGVTDYFDYAAPALRHHRDGNR